MNKIILMTRFSPSDVGHGGHHRSYQLLYDLEQIFGAVNITTIDSGFLPPSYTISAKKNHIIQIKENINERIALLLRYCYYRGNPYKFLPYLVTNIFKDGHHFGSTPIEGYLKAIGAINHPVLCIIDHPSFSPLININRELGIPTIIFPHNIEAFDSDSVDLKQEWNRFAIAFEFAKEIELLSMCEERFCISRVEAGLLGGLGLTSFYYPYRPVSLIRDRLEAIQKERSIKNIEQNLFLMLGTAAHLTTGKAFRWFINLAQTFGLPNDVRIIVAGEGTDTLIESRLLPSGLELHGWISQKDLDNLLLRVRAVLIPQLSGFGALTRLTEFSCAGIPAIVSRHPTYAIDLPPGIETAEDNWESWVSKIDQLSHNSISSVTSDYSDWEHGQINPLKEVLGKYI